jgi:two-component system response regulator YesN
MYKVMLVEDENILRKGIEVLTDWNSLNCSVAFSAPNGIEALEYANSNPIDILITDIRMPGMDGLELIKKIKEINSNIAVIILSAYREFSYAQSALALDVKQYVLKTNYREKLPLAIKSTIQEIQKHDLYEIKFDSLFLDATNQSEIDTYFELNVEKDQPYYILSIETLNDTKNSNFTEFISYAYKELNPKVAHPYNNLYLLMLCFNKSMQSRLDTLKNLTQQFISSCKTLVVMEINVGISREHYESNEFKNAHEESIDNLGRILSENTFKSDINIDKNPTSLVDCSIYAKRIIDSFISSDLSDVANINEDFFIEMESKNYDIEHQKNQASVLLSLIGTSLQERAINIEDFFKITDSFNQSILTCYSSYSLKNVVYKTSEILEKAFANYINNSISLKVNCYIENNYMYPITIEEISESIHLSSNYVGRQYKKETGENVLQHLNEYRIEKAKQLLIEGKYQISEITFKVGYSNPAYFSNVFSKITGVSPKKFIQN